MQSGSPQRDRLVEVAATLFYRHGLTNVGINQITDEANVARMTLYNNFVNKEALILDVLELQSRRRQEQILSAIKKHKTSRGKLKAFFQVAEHLAEEPDFRGCAFINAALQMSDPDSAIHGVVLAHKAWIRSMILKDILADVALPNAPMRAQTMLALWDGAIVESYIQRSKEPVRASLWAALALLGAASSRTA